MELDGKNARILVLVSIQDLLPSILGFLSHRVGHSEWIFRRMVHDLEQPLGNAWVVDDIRFLETCHRLLFQVGGTRFFETYRRIDRALFQVDGTRFLEAYRKIDRASFQVDGTRFFQDDGRTDHAYALSLQVDGDEQVFHKIHDVEGYLGNVEEFGGKQSPGVYGKTDLPVGGIEYGAIYGKGVVGCGIYVHCCGMLVLKIDNG